jgi:hypothetical protein
MVHFSFHRPSTGRTMVSAVLTKRCGAHAGRRPQKDLQPITDPSPLPSRGPPRLATRDLIQRGKSVVSFRPTLCRRSRQNNETERQQALTWQNLIFQGCHKTKLPWSRAAGCNRTTQRRGMPTSTAAYDPSLKPQCVLRLCAILAAVRWQNSRGHALPDSVAQCRI